MAEKRNRREYCKKYRLEHLEELNEKAHLRYMKNRLRRLKKQNEYNKIHREETNARNREAYKKDPEKFKKWGKANKERVAKTTHEYYIKNKEKIAEKNREYYKTRTNLKNLKKPHDEKRVEKRRIKGFIKNKTMSNIMKHRKHIKQSGNSAVVLISKEDLELYNLKIGSEITFTITNQKKFDDAEEEKDFIHGQTRRLSGGGNQIEAELKGLQEVKEGRAERKRQKQKDDKTMEQVKKLKAELEAEKQ